MAGKVVWTLTALEDLEAAAEYLAHDSPNYAATLIAEVTDAARSLSMLAERGRVVPEFENANIREIFISSYRLIYRVGHGQVQVLALIHGHRDLWRAWRDRDNG